MYVLVIYKYIVYTKYKIIVRLLHTYVTRYLLLHTKLLIENIREATHFLGYQLCILKIFISNQEMSKKGTIKTTEFLQ